MTELTIKMTYPDVRRLRAIKKLQGEPDKGDDVFASEMLERELHKLFPDIPLYGKDGELLNCYNNRGRK